MSNIKLFMKFCNVNNLEDLLKIDAQRYLVQYVVSLREKKLATNSITSRLNPVFHFYEMNDVTTINKKKIRMFKGEFMKKARDRAYTHEEIKKILDVSDLRMKVVILLMASTGMRVGALPSLRLRNLEKIDSDHKLYKVTIYEGSNEEYYSFTTPECASFIDMYLEYRSKNGEKLTKDSYLIRDQFDIRDIEQVRNHSKGVATNTIKSLIGVALIKAGVNSIDHTSKYNRKEVARCHGFRKFFTTVWINSKLKLNPEIREMLLGHKIQLASCYYRPSQDDLLQEYLKAVNDLTINEENRLKIKVKLLEHNKIDYEKLDAKIEALARKFWENNVRRGISEDDARPLTEEEIEQEIYRSRMHRQIRGRHENKLIEELENEK
jgi:integrase